MFQFPDWMAICFSFQLTFKRQNESFGDNNGEDKLDKAFRYISKTGLGARAYKNYSPTLRGLITTTGLDTDFFFTATTALYFDNYGDAEII
jgi:hypothetical protein